MTLCRIINPNLLTLFNRGQIMLQPRLPVSLDWNGTLFHIAVPPVDHRPPLVRLHKQQPAMMRQLQFGVRVTRIRRETYAAIRGICNYTLV